MNSILLVMKLPCLVSPEREDLVDTDDCTETTEDVSAIVLSVINPSPSPSVWTVIADWQKQKYNYLLIPLEGKKITELCICSVCKQQFWV